MIKIHLEYLHWAKSLQSKTESKKLIFLYSLESHKKITNFILKFDRSLGYCNCGLHSIKHPVLYDSTLFKFSKLHQLFKCSQHNLIFVSSSASHRVAQLQWVVQHTPWLHTLTHSCRVVVPVYVHSTHSRNATHLQSGTRTSCVPLPPQFAATNGWKM